MPILICPPYLLASVLSTYNEGFDPYSDYVTLLMHFNGVDGSTDITDERSHLVSVGGGAKVSSTQQKFGATSGSFGNTGYVMTPATSDLSMGSSDFTQECWFYATAFSPSDQSESVLWSNVPNTLDDTTAYGTTNISVSITQAGKLRVRSSSTNFFTSTETIALNNWYHLAISRTSGLLKIFLNGQQIYSVSFTYNLSAVTPFYIGSNTTKSGGLYTAFYGYIDEVRVTKGIGRYTANFTIPSQPFPNYFSQNEYDPYFDRVVILNHFDGIDGAAPTADVTGRSFTNVGSPALSSTKKLFGKTSCYFDGASYLDYGSSVDFNLQAIDYCVEMWVNLVSYPTQKTPIFQLGVSTAGTNGVTLAVSNAGILSVFNPTNTLIAENSSFIIPTNVWTHIALFRSSGTLTLAVNGKVAGTASDTTNLSDNTIRIGGNATNKIKAYMSELRVTRDVARYNGAFSPVLSAFANKSTLRQTDYDPFAKFVNVLMRFEGADGSSTFSDLANASRTFTKRGSPVIKTDNKKFGQSSAYFNGTSSIVSYAGGDLAFGTSDFTVEFSIYPTVALTAGRVMNLIGVWDYSNSAQSWLIRLNGAKIEYCVNQSGGSFSYVASPTDCVVANSWNAITVCRRGTLLHVFVNGVRVWVTGTSSPYSSASNFIVGGYANQETLSQYGFTGYIDEVRITKGVARYLASFTQPSVSYPDLAVTGYAYRFVDDSFIADTKAYLGFDEMVPTDLCGHALTYQNYTLSTAKYVCSSAATFVGSGSTNLTNIQFPAGSDFAPGTGDFTLEAWVNVNSSAVYGNDSTNHTATIWAQTASAALNYFWFGLYSDGTNAYPKLNTPNGAVTGPAIMSNGWNHVAVVRKNGEIKVYTNGVAGSPITNAYNFTNTTYLPTVGQLSHASGSQMFGGLMDSVRYTKAARYTADFDVRTVV